MKKTRFSAIISTFLFCYMCWFLFSETFTRQEIIVGAVVSIIVAVFTARFFVHEKSFYLFKPSRFINLIFYCIFIFPRELWKANVDVAKKALSPSIRVNPGIVKVPSELRGDYELAMLANAITLTPGTITMDITDEGGKTYFYIHWIDVAVTDSIEAGDAIKGTLEKWVRRISN